MGDAPRKGSRITRSPRVAAGFIREGGTVAFPTETVYGLGADALNPKAVLAIFAAKGRPADNPLIVHLADAAMIGLVARRVPRSAERMIEHFFPGPLTVIVPRAAAVPDAVTAGLDTVGIRQPDHPVASAFLRACAVPVAAPSANRSGRPSPTTWQAARDEVGGRVDCILTGGASAVGLESTVVDCSSGRPVILRQGAVSVEALRAVCPTIRVHHHDPAAGPVRSPGLKYRHYAPSVRVVLVEDPGRITPEAGERFAYIGLSRRGLPGRPVLVRPCREVQDYARLLFRFFRACETAGVDVIYCQIPGDEGLGRALRDRLRKAAGDHPIFPGGSGRAGG